MNEYIVVEFDEEREVIIDGYPSGNKTNAVVELGAGTHTLSLMGAKDFSPPEQDVSPRDTSPIRPYKISFRKV